jgi:uncharacterized RmlC-like cupin family protein
MEQIKTNIRLLIFATILFFVSCKDSQTPSENNIVNTATPTTTNNNNSQIPAYDPALDPLKVGAAFTKLLHDTLNIKMYEFTIKPGDSAALHAHPDHTVYVLQGGKALIYFNGGAPTEMNLVTGTGFISAGLTDAGKNIGNTTIKLLVTDIYRPRGK